MSVFDSFDDDINFSYYVYKLTFYNTTVFLAFQDLFIEVTAIINDEHIDYIIHIKSKQYIHIHQFFSSKTFYLTESEKQAFDFITQYNDLFISKTEDFILHYGV